MHIYGISSSILYTIKRTSFTDHYMAIRVAINGFGRIGRQLTRLMLQSPSEIYELYAINSLEKIEVAAHLLKYDSVHGTYPGEISIQQDHLVVDGYKIKYLSEKQPVNLPWKKHNIIIVAECSGKYTAGNLAAQHLTAGAKKILITAASKNPDKTLCVGVNLNEYDEQKHNIISGSSCTTNAIAPLLKILNETIGISACLATFLHSYTNSQPLLDTGGPDLRRARAAITSILPTTTSAVQQIPELLPGLAGKFDGLAVRVPTPDIHLADLTIRAHNTISIIDLLNELKKASKTTLQGILQVSDIPLVSIDNKGSQYSCIVDGQSVIIQGNIIKLLIWHDNESSYAKRMLELILFMAKHCNS